MTHRFSDGFTLLEVLVALAILAIALAALMRAMGQSIDVTAALRERNLALWVAQNRLTQHQMQQDWPSVDTVDGEAEMAGQKWIWREQVSTTPEPRLRRLEITVSKAGGGKESLAKLAGFLSNVKNTTP